MNTENDASDEPCKELIDSKICKTLDLGANGNVYGGPHLNGWMMLAVFLR